MSSARSINEGPANRIERRRNMEKHRRTAIEYLLGELSGEELDRFEDRVFESADFGFFVADVENDLVDDFIAGRLDAELAQKFARAYPTNDSRREKLRTARALAALPTRKPVRNETAGFFDSILLLFRRPGFAVAFGAVLIAIFIYAFSIMTRSPAERNQTAGVNVDAAHTPSPTISSPSPEPSQEPPKPNKNSGPAETNRPAADNRPERKESPTPEPKRPGRTFFATLLPATRSAGITELALTEETREVNLTFQINRNPGFSALEIMIADSSGRIVVSQGTNRRSDRISVAIPRDKLRQGRYDATVTGIGPDGAREIAGFYEFRIK